MQASFIPYLHLNDYLTTIRSDQLNNQLLDYIDEGGEFERQESEAFALCEVRSILGSYFYLDFEFRTLLPFVWNKKYYSGDRIILDFDNWVAGSGTTSESLSEEVVSYVVGDCVIYSDKCAYCCVKDTNSSSFKVGDEWIKIGKQYDIYFVQYPYELFQLRPTDQIGINHPGIYSASPNASKVCWNKKVYLCRNSSRFPSHQATEQFYSINDIPAPNMFPNQPDQRYNDGNVQWIDKGEFYLLNVLPSYPNSLVGDLNEGVEVWEDQYRPSWSFGDNRCSVMKSCVIAIAISHLMSRNSFMLKERSINRDYAYRKLKEIQKGAVTTLIPILQPEQVGDISHGGAPKIINTF